MHAFPLTEPPSLASLETVVTKLSGEAFKRFVNDDASWKADTPKSLWMDDEVIMVARVGEPERRWLDNVFDDLPDDAQVRIESGHVADARGYRGELTDAVAGWLDQERRRLETLALHEVCPEVPATITARRRL